MRAGVYSKGKNTASEILSSAIKVFIAEGYAGFSLRKVAAAAEVKLSNLQHYFPSKDALLEAMMMVEIEAYLASFEEIRSHGSAEQQLAELVDMVVEDLKTKKTTIFFPELWSLSNHHQAMTKHMEAMYRRYRLVVKEIIRAINPALNDRQVKHLALFITASLEGHTVFVGYHKPWMRETKAISSIATQSFLWLIKSGEIPD
ncbi:TetR/AcrR family transcriptional regulator [Gammaproteobacteria bacterium LSUCC0057]|uniref:TetR/AcrR family transcriptional regulator n=1 Tax=Gammaproteobacteria bacterium LSUCC0057 TaxID=2559237 RepID=A0A4Y8UIC9_9GAMM|nr:TetR/AcrR family transcriptional regulator [Gammaproteobacteria bacterium LSUCC0057]